MKTLCQPIAYNKTSNSERQSCKLLAIVKENLSDLIQRRIKELETSKAKIAEETGFSRTYIGDLANGTGNTQSGQYNLPPDSVTKLAKALKVSESEILTAMNYLPHSAKAENISFDKFKGLKLNIFNDKGYALLKAYAELLALDESNLLNIEKIGEEDEARKTFRETGGVSKEEILRREGIESQNDKTKEKPAKKTGQE